jgi:hypothetical protein
MADVGVFPRDENVRTYIRHPAVNRGFENFPEATPWPNDQFTARRLQEGAISLSPFARTEETTKPATPKRRRRNTEG